MKTRNKIIIATVSSIVLICGISACAHHRSPEDRADYMVDKISDNLELTTPQITQLEQLKDELLASRQLMQAERNLVYAELNELISQPTLDQQRALKLVQDRTESIKQKAPQVIAALAEFYDSLNPEQQAAMRKKFEDHKEHHYWRHH